MSARCPVCDWPMAESMETGCVPGSCSYRPSEGTDEWRRIKARREALAAVPRDLTVADVKAFFSLPDDDDTMHMERV
jgi:hypothetical protein